MLEPCLLQPCFHVAGILEPAPDLTRIIVLHCSKNLEANRRKVKTVSLKSLRTGYSLQGGAVGGGCGGLG